MGGIKVFLKEKLSLCNAHNICRLCENIGGWILGIVFLTTIAIWGAPLPSNCWLIKTIKYAGVSGILLFVIARQLDKKIKD